MVSKISVWKEALVNKKFLALLVVSLIIALGACACLTSFFQFIEQRPGTLIYDPVLAHIGPYNVNGYIATLTVIAMNIGMLSCLFFPCSAARFFVAVSSIILLRIIVLYLVPLEAPETIIPLRDKFLETFFYQNRVITKDLFFSGHTANVILLGLISPYKFVRNLLIVLGAIIGVLLVLQHVHYSYDVIAAPLFAYLGYQFSTKLFAVLYAYTGLGRSPGTTNKLV